MDTMDENQERFAELHMDSSAAEPASKEGAAKMESGATPAPAAPVLLSRFSMREPAIMEGEDDNRGHIVPSKELLASICGQGKNGKVPLETLLAKMTHLPLMEKGLTKITNLRPCTGLRVIYLYDNKIKRIEGLEHMGECTHLYLQNNQIEVIENIAMKKLQKLYIDGNSISLVTNLVDCPRLEELHISKQRVPRDGPGLCFDQLCMRVLANSLCILNASRCGIVDETIEMLCGLKYLEVLDLSHNNITHIEYVQLLVGECSSLQSLDLRGNPVTRRPKYRNDVIIHGQSLTVLDGKDVTQKEREFLQRLQAHKAGQKKKLEGQENNRHVNGQFAMLPESHNYATMKAEAQMQFQGMPQLPQDPDDPTVAYELEPIREHIHDLGDDWNG